MTYAVPAEAPEIMTYAAGMWSVFAKAQDGVRGRASGLYGRGAIKIADEGAEVWVHFGDCCGLLLARRLDL